MLPVPSSKAVPFFLPGSRGDLFAVYYPPQHPPARGGILYVHAFAEEANWSRPTIAGVARAIARLGYGVLTVDLYGCGESAGEFRDARWEGWHEDLLLALQWLQDRNLPQVGLWGLRLGALLALDFAGRSQRPFPFIILWHPPSSGKDALTQFLRLSLVQATTNAGSRMTTKNLRNKLASGICVEVAGWELNPELAVAMERLDLSSLISQVSSSIYWIQFAQSAPATEQDVPHSRQRIFQACEANGVALDFRHLTVRTFWADRAQMTDDSQVLIDAMNSILTRHER
ncbi:MAG TPA: hydrolase 2, exosortase A system-associated [Pyrinomonadaceae bacterium]|nr:hydrolase 2, exosortase A system-associated [Pyrinomonadaceae bacterium]